MNKIFGVLRFKFKFDKFYGCWSNYQVARTLFSCYNFGTTTMHTGRLWSAGFYTATQWSSKILFHSLQAGWVLKQSFCHLQCKKGDEKEIVPPHLSWVGRGQKRCFWGHHYKRERRKILFLSLALQSKLKEWDGDERKEISWASDHPPLLNLLHLSKAPGCKVNRAGKQNSLTQLFIQNTFAGYRAGAQKPVPSCFLITWQWHSDGHK